MSSATIWVFAVTVSLTAAGILSAAESLYVAPNGDDGNPGTMAAPFATLDRASDAIRQMKGRGLPTGGVTVFIRGGVYQREATFELQSQDSGTPQSPVVYRSYQDEEVRLVGGPTIPASALGPVKAAAIAERLDKQARGNVLAVDLKALGVTDFGKEPVRYRGAAPTPELFFNDQRMTLARWPNEGWAAIGKIIQRGSVPRHGDKTTNPGVFQYKGDRPSRWKDVGEVRLHGYWCFDWYDEIIKVKSIDTEKRQITFAAPHFYGLRQGNPSPRRYRAIGLLEEIDEPGEYYIDRKSGTLYFWPPALIADARVVLSTLRSPVVSLTGASHVALRGLTVEACIGNGIAVKDGEQCQILACHVRNTGQTGIDVRGGAEHRVEACDIHDTGTLGMTLVGGDRRKLTPAGHEAVNNHIYRFSRLQRTYASGIQVAGVGNRLAHNLLHDAPHQAIGLSGNDHVVEYNVVHHVCMETDDCGAFYMGRNPSNRGTVIRYNFWHHIGRPLGHGNNAVYFDDGDGGQTVIGNVFFRCGEPAKGNMGAVFCHGGHGNLVVNNVFVECKRAIGASPWNDRRWMSQLRGKTYQTRLLEEVDITRPPFTTRYPQLVGFMDYKPGTPRQNRAERNVMVMCGEAVYGNYVQKDNYVTKADPGFVDINRGRFALRDDSEVFRKLPGFEKIPIEEMGLRADELRSHVPEERWDYEPPKPLPHPRPERAAKPPKKKVGPPPVLKVVRATSDPKIDGAINPKEWDSTSTVTLKQDVGGYDAKPTSTAWLAYTDDHLLLAVDNTVGPKTRLTGHRWGQSEAVEIAIKNPAAGKRPPIWVLRGYPDGHFGNAKCYSGPETPKPCSKEGIVYQAKIVSAKRWTAEWRIPWQLLGIDPAKHRKLAFNLTVRKAANNLWLMWEGTRAHSYDVDRAGFIELSR